MTIVENVGAVKRLELPDTSEGGLVVVLVGAQGTGKSTALSALDNLANGSGPIPLRDGEAAGLVEGFGARITVGKKTRHQGQCEFTRIEGDARIIDLVDPGIKDPEAADRKRVKALVGLIGKTISRENITAAIGDAALALSGKPFAQSDPVETVRLAKAELQEFAREYEAQATKAEAEASARKAPEDLDLDAEHDEATLQDRLRNAIATESKMATRREEGHGIARRAEEARAKLAAAEKSYAGPTIAKAQESLGAANERLKMAEKELREAELARDRATAVADRAAEHMQLLDQWRESIDAAAGVTVPTESEVAEAIAAVEAAKQAQETGVRVRQALKAVDEAQGFALSAEKFASQAEVLRKAAADVERVLGDAIDCDELKWVNGRLVTKTGRGTTMYADLSDGERFALAFKIVAPTARERGLLVIPQTAWEGLDISNQRLVAELAKKHKLTIFAARAQREGEDPEIHAELFSTHGETGE